MCLLAGIIRKEIKTRSNICINEGFDGDSDAEHPEAMWILHLSLWQQYTQTQSEVTTLQEVSYSCLWRWHDTFVVHDFKMVNFSDTSEKKKHWCLKS